MNTSLSFLHTVKRHAGTIILAASLLVLAAVSVGIFNPHIGHKIYGYLFPNAATDSSAMFYDSSLPGTAVFDSYAPVNGCGCASCCMVQ